MATRSVNGLLTSVDSLFTTQQERDEANLKKIYDIPISEIDDFPEHPYQVNDDEDIQFAPVKQTLFDCVSAKFDCCGLDKGSSFSEPLKEYLLECEELQGFDTEVFPLIIEKIIVNRDSSINIELVNGQIVNSNGKEC